MHVEAWDTVFVRARRADVHPVLRDVAGYGLWWPGLRASPADGRVRLRHRPPGMWRGAHTVEVEITRERADRGLDICCRGDVEGEAEWFYLDEVDGVTVHYVLRADIPPRRAALRLAAHRASVRAAMNALKDRLERGREAGSEPDPALLAHQAEARAGRTGQVGYGG